MYVRGSTHYYYLTAKEFFLRKRCIYDSSMITVFDGMNALCLYFKFYLLNRSFALCGLLPLFTLIGMHLDVCNLVSQFTSVYSVYVVIIY